VKAEFVGNLRRVHRIRQVLLVRENEEEGIAEFVFVEHLLQLFAGLRHTFPIIRIDYEDDALCVLEVFSRCKAGKGARKKIGQTMIPQTTNLVLATDVPHGEGNVLVLDSLDVET
jgi:hypothetical protein